MDIDQLLTQSLQLLGLGMGSVFVILSLLIGIISIISRLVPEENQFVATASHQDSIATDTQHIAAIQAAIHKFRKSRNN